MSRDQQPVKWSIGLLLIAVLSIIIWGSAALFGNRANSEASSSRAIAVTFDDLPSSEMWGGATNAKLLKERTLKLIHQIKKNNIPAIGFTNSGKVFHDGKLKTELAALFNLWIDAGIPLGNHTYGHKDINRVPWDEYREDVIKGELVVKDLVEKNGHKFLYFRHPFLHAGNSKETKAKLEKLLAERDYIVAPVTMDNSEWIFARAYFNALNDGNKKQMKRTLDAYIDHMDSILAYYEQQSKAIFGYEIKHILLLHANALNADHLDRLVKTIKKRGYKFITIEEALQDKAYESVDKYTGGAGITWLHRWALTMGKRGDFFKGEPETPEFVQKLAGIQQ
jgi:peptidoglycan/xylan/chitin deacetylase (PgdA/CDA1 family)